MHDTLWSETTIKSHYDGKPITQLYDYTINPTDYVTLQ